MKQGDPQSPFLFNCVINWALEYLDLEMGVVAGEGSRLNHLAFADWLPASLPVDRGALERCDLRLNADKSRMLRISVNCTAKKWVSRMEYFPRCRPTRVYILGHYNISP